MDRGHPRGTRVLPIASLATLRSPRLSPAEVDDLVAFLETLSEET
jgi:hypothetical protein